VDRIPNVKTYKNYGIGWNISAVCQQLQYGGTVSPGTTSISAFSGEVAEVITPAKDFSIQQVLVNGVDMTSTLVMSADQSSGSIVIPTTASAPVNIDVFFYNAQIGAQYDVYASSTDNIILVDQAGASMVSIGQSVTFNLTPAKAHCFVSNINVDGVDGQPLDITGNSFTLSNVMGSHTVTVSGNCVFPIDVLPSKSPKD
jgi:hypothetical protein